MFLASGSGGLLKGGFEGFDFLGKPLDELFVIGGEDVFLLHFEEGGVGFLEVGKGFFGFECLLGTIEGRKFVMAHEDISLELRIVGVEKDELLSGIESLLEKLESLVGVAEPELEVAELVERNGEVALELRIVGVEKDELLATVRACWKNSRALSVLPRRSWMLPSRS